MEVKRDLADRDGWPVSEFAGCCSARIAMNLSLIQTKPVAARCPAAVFHENATARSGKRILFFPVH